MAIIFNFLYIFILFFPIYVTPSFAGRDHAPIYGPREEKSLLDKALEKLGKDREDYRHHEAAAEIFKDKYFRNPKTNQITLEKTNAFLDKLLKEYEDNTDKLYETEFLEQLDIKKSHFKKAQKKAKEELKETDILPSYELYLIPKIREMIAALKAKTANQIVEALLDDFIRGYTAYFNPNPFNNMYKNKVNPASMIYRIFKSPTRKIKDDKIQANNLLVENEEQMLEINKILIKNNRIVAVGDFLENQDIKFLLLHNFDISTINPGESALWIPITPEEKEKVHERDPELFPDKATKKIFHHVMLGGANSPKLKVDTINGQGEPIRLKLKVGDEVPSELASASLMRILGFSRDKSIYEGDINVHLGGKTFEEFEAELRQKVGPTSVIRFDYERGIDDNGERYITWRDSLFESRPKYEKRISPLDIASWDLQNRREYRGIELAYAWLGVNDLKTDNVKSLLVKKAGKWIPQHRMHDLGVSLGSTLVINNPDGLLSFPAPYGKVNQFETSIVKKKKDGVKIRWNDFTHQDRKYGSTTYYDLKWMARKIALITEKDIDEALANSGMNPDSAHLFGIKLRMRRNNIITSFELQGDFPLFDTPLSLEKYSPISHPNIINGEIKLTAYEGKNVIPIRIRTWGSLFSSLLVNVSFNAFTQQFLGQNKMSGGVVGSSIVLRNTWKQEWASPGALSKLSFQPGITIVPSRRVFESSQNLNTAKTNKNGDVLRNEDGAILRTSLPYMVEDKIKIIIGVQGNVEKIKYFPINGNLKIGFIEKTLIHRHFVDSIKEGWLSPFSLPKIIFGGEKKFATKYLKDLDDIDSFYTVGPSLDLNLGLSQLKTNVALGAAAVKFGRTLLHRDQFGRLHYLQEKITEEDLYAQLKFLNLDVKIANASFCDVKYKNTNHEGETTDLLIGVKDDLSLQSHDHQPHTKERADKELAAFRQLETDPDNAEVVLNFNRKFKTNSTNKKASLAFVFARESSRHFGEVDDIYINRQENKLFQGAVFSGKHLGIKDLFDIHKELTDFAVKKGKSKKTIVEANRLAPEKFLLTVNNRILSRKSDRKSLIKIIKKLNSRYSDNPTKQANKQFFASLSLPDQDEQDEYRKIYAEIKVQIDGEYFLEKVRTVEINDIKYMIKQFFSNSSINIKKAKLEFDDNGEALPNETSHKITETIINKISFYHKKNKIITNIIRLKTLLEQNHREEDYWDQVWLLSMDIVHALDSKYYGVHILRDFLNINESEKNRNKGLLVYGEIQNIGDHITSLQRPHNYQANLRNAGKHWGSFEFDKDKIRPVQYFLKFENPVGQFPSYASVTMDSEQILGQLERGQALNFSGEGI